VNLPDSTPWLIRCTCVCVCTVNSIFLAEKQYYTQARGCLYILKCNMYVSSRMCICYQGRTCIYTSLMLHNIYVLDVTYNFKRDTVIMLFDSAMSVTDANDDFSGKNVFPLFVIRTSTDTCIFGFMILKSTFPITMP
jgi:hypothetical protein